MYVEIKDNKLLSWCEKPYLDYEYVDIDYLTFDPNKYEVQNCELVDISQTQEYKGRVAAEKEIKFLNNFIEISIGWLRKTPKGYSSLVEAMNSALNVVYINENLPAGVLTIYPKPDFATVDDIEKYLEEHSYKNQAMAAKEFGALYVEFMNKWNSQEHV